MSVSRNGALNWVTPMKDEHHEREIRALRWYARFKGLELLPTDPNNRWCPYDGLLMMPNGSVAEVLDFKYLGKTGPHNSTAFWLPMDSVAAKGAFCDMLEADPVIVLSHATDTGRAISRLVVYPPYPVVQAKFWSTRDPENQGSHERDQFAVPWSCFEAIFIKE